MQLQITFDRLRKDTQAEKILRYLQSGKSLTPLESLSLFGCFRLGARIFDLKERGFKIEKKMVETPGGARVACYRMEAA